MRQTFLLLGCTLAVAASGNPYLTETLDVTHVEGCTVKLDITRRHGLPRLDAERARARFAFDNPSCSAGVPVPATFTTKNQYDSYSATDTVCGDGRWYYRLKPTSPSERAYFTSKEVVVTGCKGSCPALLEAPARVVEATAKPPCEVTMSTSVSLGESRELDWKLGKVIRGQGIVEVVPVNPQKVKGVSAGRAWLQDLTSGASRGCAELEVTPKSSQPMTLAAVKQWAFRMHDPAPATDEPVVALKKGERWPLPLAGTLWLDRYDPVAQLAVDDACRPALQVKDRGYTGVLLVEPGGARHRYLINATGAALGLPCVVAQRTDLRVGEMTRELLPPEVVDGEDIVEQLPEHLVRPKKAGVQLRREPGSAQCMRVTVEPAFTTREQKIASARSRYSNKSVPDVIEMKVGQKLVYPFPVDTIRGSNDGIVETQTGPSGLGLEARYEGYTAMQVSGPEGERLVYIEVSAR